MTLALCSAGGCGRPATAEECEEIVERMARLEIERQRPGRAETVQAEVDAMKEKHRQAINDQCVGNRITDQAMRCVREAESPEAIRGCFH